MDTKRHCPACRKPLAEDVPMGLCPECLVKAGFRTEGEPQADFDPPPIPEIAARFPQFEILGFIGRGGMGAVYKARQPSLDRLIALKILQPVKAGDPGFAERFNREARALARLNHPNIVAVYDFGSAGDLSYLAMEFVDGANLREVGRSARLTPEQALRIVPQICDALQFAHNEGVVHRDIKPENILLDRKMRVKIADFGIAKIVGATPEKIGLTGARDVVGTPHYMAPEQLEQPGAVDHRADIFSLGVVFYELLTGELPIGKFSPPSQKVEVDVRLDDVVLRALEREPARRYQHASEVKSDVQAISQARPPLIAPQVPPPEFHANISNQPRRGGGRVWIGIGIAVVALILCFLLGSVVLVFVSKRNPATTSQGLLSRIVGPGNQLHYAWKPGETLVYSVKVETTGDDSIETVSGNVTYTVRSVDGDRATLSYMSHLGMPVRRPKPGRQMPMSFPHGPGNFWHGPPFGMAPRELQVDAAGKILSQSGDGNALPQALGSLERLIFEPLPASASDHWETKDACVVTQTRFVPISPVSHFGREEEVTLAAKETASYEIVSTSGTIVQIKKQYELKTDETIGGEPRVKLTGEGTISFDTAASLPRSMEFQGTLTEASDNTTYRTPLALSYTRLENATNGTASATVSAPPQPAQPEELTVSASRELLMDLRSPDTAPRNIALSRLASAKPVEPREEVVEAITSAMADSNWSTRQSAARALGVWGNSNSVPALIKLLDDSEFSVRWAAMDALARLKNPAAAGPLAKRLADRTDSMQAANALKVFGGAAEDAVIEQLRAGNDETREAACRVLREIGTAKSIEPLTAACSRTDGILSMLAKDALGTIEARKSK